MVDESSSSDLRAADELRELISRAGLSQRAAARELGVDVRTMRYWCAGNPPPPPMVLLALSHRPEQRCAICTEAITPENNSEEHVILEAVGGRLEVRGFICRPCNNRTGHEWDAELAKQLLPLCHIFDIERRGGIPPLAVTTTAGEQLVIRADGPMVPQRPTFSKEERSDGTVQIQMTARSLDEAKRMVAGVQGKYPTVQAVRILETAQVVAQYPRGWVNHELKLGGELSGRSMVKSALAMAHFAGIPATSCSDALSYLGDLTGEPCYGYFQVADLVVDRPVEVPLHCVAIEASPTSGLILAYIEYFGIHRVVACLGRRYAGDHIQACYAIDPRVGTRLDISVRLEFTEDEVRDIYEYKMIAPEAMKAAIARLMPAALKKKFDTELERVAAEAVRYGLENCGAKPGETLTADHLKIFSQLAAQRMTPFLMHNRPKRHPAADNKAE